MKTCLFGWIVLAPLAVLVSCCPSPGPGASRVVAGPMPGWSGHREVEIWAMLEGPATDRLVYWPEGQPGEKKSIPPVETLRESGNPAIVRYRPSLLVPGMRYVCRLETPDASAESRFQTQADWTYKTEAPDFSFIFGSCLYLNDPPYDRPGKPYGQGDGILGLMAQSKADFMLWLGDNSYLRPADLTSPAGIRYRMTRDRCDASMQDLLRGMHHFAIWDDHDFGPDNSSKSFPLRDATTRVFREFWANPPSGLPQDQGIMSTFVWSDCLFVLLDNRSNRDSDKLDLQGHPGKTMLGSRQIEWLEQTLLENRGTPFKFIVQGGQFLKDQTYESYADFPGDRKRILDFIQKHKIGGVVFIGGDRHFTEVNRFERAGDYPLYEVTSSPIASGVAVGALKLEAVNPMRVPGTLVDLQNFCRIDVHGNGKQRTATIRSVDKTGVERWKLDIPAADLRRP